MNILVDLTQIPIQKVGVGVYAKETFKFPNEDANELFFWQLYTILHNKIRVQPLLLLLWLQIY